MTNASPIVAETSPRATGPLLVEIAGPPGAGKTTAGGLIEDLLRQGGWRTHRPETGARLVVGRTSLGGAIRRFVPWPRLRHMLLWRLYLLHRYLLALRRVVERPAHVAWLVRYQRRRPAGALARQRRVVLGYLRHSGAQEFFRRWGHADEAFLFDEGYVHRVVQLFSSPVDVGNGEDIARYLTGVPRSDLVVAVKAPTAERLERVRRRGVWGRMAHLTAPALEAYLDSAEAVVEEAVMCAQRAGWRVWEIDNGDPDGGIGLTRRARARWSGAVPVPVAPAGGVQPPPRELIFRVGLPGPRRAADLLANRLRAPAVGGDTIDLALAHFGLVRQGAPRNVGTGRRSRSLAVATDAGRVVIRAYPSHWSLDTIYHEHALLDHLQRLDYPAVRLCRAPGSTIADLGVVRLAVFRHAPGRSLGGWLLSPGTRRQLYRLSGCLLAQLHAQAGTFVPPRAHHLSVVDPADAEWLRQHMALLQQLSEGVGTDPAERWLAAQSGRIAERLGELHALVTGAGARRSVIHGDFGLHNVLFQRSGAATVHDFELARHDWCLVDVAEVLSRVPVSSGRAFLSGYRSVSEDDWELLGPMWELHRLAGAVRTWDAFARRGSPERLATARSRVAEAAVVRREGTARWM